MEHHLIDAWHSGAVALLPPGIEVWDAHTHTGSSDPDGYSNSVDSLLSALERAGHHGAVVCSHADPHGYRAQNARILSEHRDHPAKLIPFLRVDPKAAGAAEDVSRQLVEGFRGVKIHPRSERFTLDDPRVAEVAAAAAERRAPVLVHAGRGMPALGEALLDLIDSTPGLEVILAHAAISDLGWIGFESHSRPGLFFDTAWWNVADTLALFATVDATQILYASDMPYWIPRVAVTLSTRAAVQAGLSGAALSAVFGGNLNRLLAGTPVIDRLGVGSGGYVDPMLFRVASNLYAAIGAARTGRVGVESIDLALRATEAGASPNQALLKAIRQTIEAAAEAAEEHIHDHITFLLLACGAALTPLAGAPALG
jgi:predicted TIM-barrel fold metal-dependent hydrolase